LLRTDEVQQAASERGRLLSSGWSISVGVVGWSIGGGHGPFAPSKGMGVDNVLEVELVTADGSLVVANAEQNSDLWWALRGGGGSAFGVITSITLRAHATPEGGLSRGVIAWEGNMCTNDRQRLHNILDGFAGWSLRRDERWSGLVFHTLAPALLPAPIPPCGATWHIFAQCKLQSLHFSKPARGPNRRLRRRVHGPGRGRAGWF